MSKAYKTGFSAFLNTRLKPVDYHGTLTYPIYVRVVFKRYNTVFKSYYFDLFSKEKYQINFAGLVKFPTVAEIIALEENIITLILARLKVDILQAGHSIGPLGDNPETPEACHKEAITLFMSGAFYNPTMSR